MKLRDPERFKQHDDGDWWLYRDGKPWGRCPVLSCTRCGEQFVAYPGNHKAKYCSRVCAGNGIAIQKGGFKRENGMRWKGGRTVRRGYVFIHSPQHPAIAGTKRKYVAEHRLVMERQLGRYLQSSEQVHHKNGIKDDNRAENLELWIIQQPAGQRTDEYRCCSCCTGACRE